MAKLGIKQKERISEMAGNVAVAWFAAAVIAPFFAQKQAVNLFASLFGLISAIIFFSIALHFAEIKTKK